MFSRNGAWPRMFNLRDNLSNLLGGGDPKPCLSKFEQIADHDFLDRLTLAVPLKLASHACILHSFTLFSQIYKIHGRKAAQIELNIKISETDTELECRVVGTKNNNKTNN